jgi:ornithine--oxo-acid transaminase
MKRSFAGGLVRPGKNTEDPTKSEYFMALEYDYGCHNYSPLPVVIAKGKGVHLWDVEGKKYFDYLAAYSAVNQGHNHPKIREALIKQSEILTLTSRAYYNNMLGPWEKYLCELFKYEKVLLMNTGVEACESAIKLARRWAYDVKKVPDNQAHVLFAANNFWGRTIAACGASDDPDRYRRFGPFGGLNFHIIPYDDTNALEAEFKKNPNIAAYMVEPIQGEAGVVIPKKGYMKKVRELCTKYKVLLICDEVQTGLGRTGKLIASEWDEVRPDIVTLGKALSGGYYPISAVLCDNEIMQNIHPGEHGSTYGGNPFACAIGGAALDVLIKEKMVENSANLGATFLKSLKEMKRDFITDVRGRGLFAAIEVDPKGKVDAWDISLRLKENGLLAKPTHGNIIRFSPPLVITKEQIEESLTIIKKVIASY